MAEKNKQGWVTLLILKNGPHDEANQLISLNGVNYVVPKGIPTLVPPEIKAEYDRSMAARALFDETFSNKIELTRKPTNM